MKTIFLKSHILHIRTNEGVFEVSNPEEFEAAFIPLGVTIEQYFKSFEGADHPEWPGGVEFETIAPHPECYKARECLQLTNGLNCSQAYDARTRSTSLCAKAYKLARLIPEEKKEFKPAQPTPNFPKGGTTFTESAYKEFEGKGKLIGHIIDDFKNGKEIFVPAVESSEPQEKSIESEKYELRRILQMQVNCLREDEMDNSDAVAIRGTTAQRIMKFLDPVSAPSESQEELWQSSNPNKERYVQLSNVHSDGMPEPWLRFWEQIEIWYGDIQKRETGVQLLERLRKEGFKITRNP